MEFGSVMLLLSSQIANQFVKRVNVKAGVVVSHMVGGVHRAEFAHGLLECGIILALPGKVIQSFVILNPEHDVPSLIIAVPVISLVGCSHVLLLCHTIALGVL